MQMVNSDGGPCAANSARPARAFGRFGPVSFALGAGVLLGLAVFGGGAGQPGMNGTVAEAEPAVSHSPIADVLASMPDDVREFNTHLETLASRYMAGRVPGSPTAERWRTYVEEHFRESGLEPAFPDEGGAAFASYRQPFELGGTTDITAERLAVEGVADAFRAEVDFVGTGLAGEGIATGGAVFVGYSIARGPDGYTSYPEGTDLTGRIAVMLRFEPMTDEGKSRWNRDGRWSRRASFDGKIEAAQERGAAGIIVINTPGADDDRVGTLDRFTASGARGEVPAVLVSPEAGARLIAALGSPMTLEALRREADERGGVTPLPGRVTVEVEADTTPTMAVNVGGVIPGVGDLADEWIVVGAHADHLGMGYFGSRSGPGKLHPGADDNASGTAGLIILADKLRDGLAGSDAPRRSILLVAFDGEESGLNGSRHYVNEPIAALDDHVLMVNWDMIGRVTNNRLAVYGSETAEGIRDFLEPFFASSELEIVTPAVMSGASDHTSFYRRNIPVLFSIIADFHADYHTPEDVSWKINRLGAVRTVRMYDRIVRALAERPEAFPFDDGTEEEAPAPEMPRISVRMGVMPAYNAEGLGIAIDSVSDGGPAALAGIRAGDRLVRWDGQKIENIEAWMGMLARHSPGDEVRVGVIRDGGAEQTLVVTLQGR